MKSCIGRARLYSVIPGLFATLASAQDAGVPCKAEAPAKAFTIPHRGGSPDLTVDPESPEWRKAAKTFIEKDCSRTVSYQELRTEEREFWTNDDLYLLILCPYKNLNLFLPAVGGGPRVKLWDRDVVEVFLGDDWKNIRHYREFEIAPTGHWIDLAIDLDKQSYDPKWRSGWKTAARIDEATRTW